MAKLFADAACIAITAFISPYRTDRNDARALHERAGLPFIEVFIDAPLHVVENRDPKGLYKKARAGVIKGLYHVNKILNILTIRKEFTGISAPYEPPSDPEVHIKTDQCNVDESVRIIADYLENKGFL